MDDLSRNWYRLSFENRFLKCKGNEFQSLFSDVMERAYPGDFIRIRPHGPLGDLKCDGYRASTKTVFQVYGPLESKMSKLIGKIKTDFAGALQDWPGKMDEWIFVHNNSAGLQAQVLQLLLGLQSAHAPLRVSNWGFADLARIVDRLSEKDCEAMMGIAPTRRDLDNLNFGGIELVLGSIMPMKPPDDIQIAPVPVNKIESNQLSSAAANLLKLGWQKEKLVEEFLDHWHDPALGEALAEAYRTRYAALKNRGISPDEIFGELFTFTAGDGAQTPEYIVAVLAVVAYFFQRCDIFESPQPDQLGYSKK